MLQRAARNAYSWWWASHIRTKQSKWLDDNLQDMEEKVAYMLKIVDDDGDSFRQRAEMYYKKRPELINLVEESFRGYRALAERYDHLSKELQSANRTIASIYPERVQLHMDDEEAEDFSPTDASSSPQEIRKLQDNFPDPPKLDIPKPMLPIKNTGKKSSRLMSIKRPTDDARPATPSGLSKSEALKEIDKLHKTILAFQTEKEFVKSTYENGVEKYWEIENQVTEMQAKVSNLQDEFGLGSFIEDDEARTLMTATALKSCQQTLARLQKKQKESDMAALFEWQKVKEVREKFKIFKEEFQRNNASSNQSVCGELQLPAPNLETMNLEKQIDSEIEGSIDVEALRAKIKEELQVSSGDSLGATELAEKVDELVDKVIKMEWEIASQNACVKMLGSETNYLQEHLASLQQENESLIENPDSKNTKIRELEEELQSIQSLNQCVTVRSNNFQTHLTEASCNLDDLSEQLQNVKQDEDVGSILNHLIDAPGIKSMEQFQDSGGPVMTLEEDEVPEALQDLPKQAGNDLIDFQFGDVAETGPRIQSEAHEYTTSSQLIEYDNTNGMPKEHEGFNPFVDTATSPLTKQDNINEMPKQHEGFNPFVDVYKEKDVDATAVGNDSKDTTKIHGAPSFSHDTLSKIDEVRMTTMSRSTAPEAELRSDHDVDQVDIEEAKRHDLFQRVYGDPYLEQAELGIEGDQPNWKELFLNGIDDREKILLKEYTSILRNYKEIKMKLNEVEKKRRASTFQHAIQVKLLKSYNAVKDAEIQSFYQKLNSDEKEKDNVPDSPQTLKEPSYVSHVQSSESNQSALHDIQEKTIFGTVDVKEESTHSIPSGISYIEEEGEGGDIKIINAEEAHTFSTIEEKIRMDIDELLEENIECWLRFSTSFHQIQKFQNSIQDLKAELTKLRATKKDDSQDKKNLQLSDVRPIYRHLREIQTELSLWLDHNAVLEDDLANRLSSLSSIHEEMTRLSSIGSETEEGELSPYQAAKFQGEIMNMKQENNKIANELESGLSRVKNLQLEIQETLNGLDKELGMTKTQARKSRIPLRSFLFGVKLKKQRQSIFSCVTPSLQKQSSDIGT